MLRPNKFIRFWKKDIINKLITLVILLIFVALVYEIIFFIRPRPAGTSLLKELFPTPTLEPKVILTIFAATSQYQAAMATASVPPTMTTMPFTPMVKSSTPTSTLDYQLTAAASSATPVPTFDLAAGMVCIPDSPRQTGKVVAILDGVTMKVLIDDLVYQVRYLGIKAPENGNFAQLATNKNAELVFLKEITLIGDGVDKDPVGRLLRYVIVEDKFVNLELLHEGYANIDETAPASACTQVFERAEEDARTAQRGIWK